MERSEWTPKPGEMVGVVPVDVASDGILITSETVRLWLSLSALHPLPPALTPEAAEVLEAVDALLESFELDIGSNVPGRWKLYDDLTNKTRAWRASKVPTLTETEIYRRALENLSRIISYSDVSGCIATTAFAAAAKAKDAGHE